MVELLVVITIIGMLVGLLMPAVQSAREAGRRAQCMNNQHQIALAFLQYEGERLVFPGYVGEYRDTISNKIVQRKISWWIAILPYFGRMDVSDLWRDLNITVAGTGNYDGPGNPAVVGNRIPSMMMKLGVCPSFSPPSPNDSWLSYRVNVGRMTPNAYLNDTAAQKVIAQAIPAEGVFTDQYQDEDPNNPANPEILKSIGLEFIGSKDGPSCTLMLAENSASVPPIHAWPQDGKWAPLIINPIGDGAVAVTDYQTLMNASVLGFNWCDMLPRDPNNPLNNQTPNQKIYSNHPGGVIVSFCGGHQSFLRNDIEPVIYMQLMCPSDRDVYDPAATATAYGILNPLILTNPVPPLDENRY